MKKEQYLIFFTPYPNDWIIVKEKFVPFKSEYGITIEYVNDDLYIGKYVIQGFKNSGYHEDIERLLDNKEKANSWSAIRRGICYRSRFLLSWNDAEKLHKELTKND